VIRKYFYNSNNNLWTLQSMSNLRLCSLFIVLNHVDIR
jgi:hypothetical protein